MTAMVDLEYARSLASDFVDKLPRDIPAPTVTDMPDHVVVRWSYCHIGCFVIHIHEHGDLDYVYRFATRSGTWNERGSLDLLRGRLSSVHKKKLRRLCGLEYRIGSVVNSLLPSGLKRLVWRVLS